MERKKKEGNSYEKEKTCKLCYENVALDRFCGGGIIFALSALELGNMS